MYKYIDEAGNFAKENWLAIGRAGFGLARAVTATSPEFVQHDLSTIGYPNLSSYDGYAIQS